MRETRRNKMAQITVNQPGGVPRWIPVVAGMGFMVLFALWVLFYRWFSSIVNGDELKLGVIAAVFWLLVFGLVLAAVMFSRVAIAGWETRDLMLVAVVGAA